MDTRHIDEANEEVSFDLLKAWISAATRRSVGQTRTPGCSWSSLLLALRHAGVGILKDGEPVTEENVRQILVGGYERLDRAAIHVVVAAKLRGAVGRRGSFFRLLGEQCGDEEARSWWTWYLYCLTFPSSEDAPQSVVRMPLDMVDLQMLALHFGISITVSRYLRDAIRLRPRLPAGGARIRAIHLVMHRGLWAPLLGPRPKDAEVHPLVGTLVELLGLEHRFGHGARWGAVVSYDLEHESYVVLIGDDWRRVLVDRLQIGRVIYYPHVLPQALPTTDVRTDSADDSVEVFESELLAGVPEGALEWQVLQELVRREARVKLETMMQVLAGRGDAAAATAAAAQLGTAGAVGLKVYSSVPSLQPSSKPADAAHVPSLSVSQVPEKMAAVPVANLGGADPSSRITIGTDDETCEDGSGGGDNSPGATAVPSLVTSSPGGPTRDGQAAESLPQQDMQVNLETDQPPQVPEAIPRAASQPSDALKEAGLPQPDAQLQTGSQIPAQEVIAPSTLSGANGIVSNGTNGCIDGRVSRHGIADNTSQAPFPNLACLRVGPNVLVERLKAGNEISVFVTSTPLASSSEARPVYALGDKVKVEHIREGWLLAKPAGDSRPVGAEAILGRGLRSAWCPCDCFLLYVAWKPFKVPSASELPPGKPQSLSLEIGDGIVVSKRYGGDWHGWGYGVRWGVKRSALLEEGIVHLSYLHPHFLVGECLWDL